MKVFVYDKKNNHVVAVFERVDMIRYNSQKGILTISDEYGQEHCYDRKFVKTRIYQN